MVVCLMIFFMKQVSLCPKKVEKHCSKQHDFLSLHAHSSQPAGLSSKVPRSMVSNAAKTSRIINTTSPYLSLSQRRSFVRGTKAIEYKTRGPGQSEAGLDQCFSTTVPWHTSVPRDVAWCAAGKIEKLLYI